MKAGQVVTRRGTVPPSLRGLPKPENDAELEIVSAYYFGSPVHLVKLYVGHYEVAEDFNSYDPFDGDYDAHRRFWDWVCGPLHCGGTARASYGSFHYGHRQRRRLERWISSRRTDGGSPVRPAFARLAERQMGSEGTPRTADRGVLTSGRVDGARAASFAAVEILR